MDNRFFSIVEKEVKFILEENGFVDPEKSAKALIADLKKTDLLMFVNLEGLDLPPIPSELRTEFSNT